MDVLLFVASATLVTLVQVRQPNGRMGQSSSQTASSSQNRQQQQSSEAAAASTLLVEAAVRGDLARIRALVAEHAPSSNDGETKAAASFLNEPDASGNAAVHGAVFGGHLEVVRYLHEQQQQASSTAATADAVLTLPNGLGCTPLWLAAGYNRAAILEYLLQQHSTSLNNTTAKEALLATNSTGDTPLLAAASRGHAAVCQRLLRAAAALEEEDDCARRMAQKVNRSGDSPLAVAVAAGIRDEALLDQLIQLSCSSGSGSSSNAILDRPNAKGITPLLVACERDCVEVVQKLLPHVSLCASSTSNNNNNGDTPLGVAAFCGSERVLKLLLEQQQPKDDNAIQASTSLFPVNERNPQTGCTPLFLAVRAGHTDCARLLLEAGADASLANGQGLTPLEAAQKFRASPGMVELLLRQQQQQSTTTTTTTQQ